MTSWFQPESEVVEIGGRELVIETGRMAKQAAGAALVTYGETVVLVTVARAKPRAGLDFFPLTVDFVEKTSAAGKIPGGFFKREGRLSEREVLVSRFIDRAIRPLFAEGYRDDTQITATVLSADGEVQPDISAFIGASAALCISEIPFLGPIAAVRVGRIDGEFVANPLHSQVPTSDVELIVAGNRIALVMVEGSAREVPEPQILDALKFAHAQFAGLIDAQEKLRARVGKPKLVPAPQPENAALAARVAELADTRLRDAVRISVKQERYRALADVEAEVIETLSEEYLSEKVAFDSLRAVEERRDGLRVCVQRASDLLRASRSAHMRAMILDEGRRIDGRASSDIRPITCQVRVVPRAHGTALFTRGETQALVFATLGSGQDEQTIDALTERTSKSFMLHYNFPPFSVGEVRPLRGPGRREVGHGALAERAIQAVLPPHADFPYTIRVVAEILESNGSSSMASVCGATLALMDAGVALTAPVAGIAMGLIQEDRRIAILSDILGDEDHLGDMDFKCAGTRAGITAVQMDIKIPALDWQVMERALEQARVGRLHILDCMERETADDLDGLKPRPELAPWAPRMQVIHIKPDRIRDVIGPGGKVIRAIQETTGARIDIEDSGRVAIFAPDVEALARATAMVEELTQEAEIGRLYLAKVKRVVDFGAFVEIFPGTEGLVHISHLAQGRVEKVTDVVSEGDEMLVKCIDIDPSGRIRLSRKEALADAIS